MRKKQKARKLKVEIRREAGWKRGNGESNGGSVRGRGGGGACFSAKRWAGKIKAGRHGSNGNGF